MKDVAERSQDCILGMQVIERAVYEAFKKAGVVACSDNFQWNRGKSVVPPPEVISLEVTAKGAPYFRFTFSREQVEDCHERIDRMEVRLQLETFEEKLAAMRAERQ